MTLWQRSRGLAIQIWEDLTADDFHRSLLDSVDQIELERFERIRSRARWFDAAILPFLAYLALLGATLLIPWASLGQVEQMVFGAGLLGLWGLAIWQSAVRGRSSHLLAAIVLVRRFRPGQRVWVHAVRPGFVSGIVTARTRTRVVVRPLTQDSPIPLSPLDVQIVPQVEVPTPVRDHSSAHSSQSDSE